MQNILLAMVNAFATIPELFLNADQKLFLDGHGKQMVTHKSMLRLNNPTGQKFGGDSRVKRVEIHDEWNSMTNEIMESFEYGQEYDYTLDDGTSSGVASYEPQLGGDENPWKQPIFYSNEKKMIPDERSYMEEPLGEGFFPSPTIGYSKVTVKNLQHDHVTAHATGKVVHEFYTAKEFPTFTSRTDKQLIRQKTDPFSLASIFKFNFVDNLSVSQGFVVELNDMHGKPKSQNVYAEGQSDPISSVQYRYRATPRGDGTFKLNNGATVIYPNGGVGNAQIGVFYDVINDMMEQTTESQTSDISGNSDKFIVFGVPIIAGLPWFSTTKEETAFRKAATTKVIQRFGILHETIATDLGSRVSTRDLAYDAHSGQPILTVTTNDFSPGLGDGVDESGNPVYDRVYNLTYPAYWHYREMGGAYQNIGYTRSLNINNGAAHVPNAPSFYVEGDELALPNGVKGWVVEVNPSSIQVLDMFGTPISSYGVAKIIRSGNRNMQTEAMATITSLSNPLNSISNNIYDRVVQASAIKFANEWRIDCECLGNEAIVSTTNPFVLGTKGYWKPQKSFLHLTDRTQSDFDNNTNIRRDGIFQSYTPYYRLTQNGNWVQAPPDWTFTSEITEFSPYGHEVENRDALNRFSASTYGYNQTLPLSVGANTQYKELGFDNFEDYPFAPCQDRHFKFDNASDKISTEAAHSGKNSIKVNNTNSAILHRQLVEQCPPTSCNIQASITPPAAANNVVIEFDGGIEPYYYNWTILNGNPTVEITEEGIVVTGSDWEIQFELSDGIECSYTNTFSWEEIISNNQ